MGRRPRVALTPGDPAGIGGELAAKLLAAPQVYRDSDVLVIATREELDRAAQQAGVRIDVADVPDRDLASLQPCGPVLIDPGRPGPLPTTLGRVSRESGRWALDALRYTLGLVEEGLVDGICFTPLNKTSLHLAGMESADELRWFAETLCFRGTTSELNVLDRLWTARVTSHIALAEVAEHITTPAVTATIMLLDSALRESGIASPRIAVAALNPHAGENGSFGRQEIDVIAPAIGRARGDGIDATGPFPSDTIFLKARAGSVDGVVTMYHDQGQIAMKLMGFDRGVTVQGGLPVPITTPAHGSAFDIVGRNRANPQATFNAFRLAATMARRRAALRSAHR